MFLDEGGPIGSLLEIFSQKRGSSDEDADSFQSKVIGAYCAEQGIRSESSSPLGLDSGLAGSLSRRELQVLSLAASRISNREIGDALGLTEGSVKWYLQQVYDKLGVRRRSEAARKARQFGLIN
jgi:LuxR family maltose regulon positive regulatory protein